MADCSLCGSALQPEGGAILFTDNRGVPFEVCGKCEGSIDVLHTTADETELHSALDYISGYADELEYRDTYATLMSFIKNEESEAVPYEAVDTAEEPEEHEESSAPKDNDIAETKLGKYMPLVVVIVVAGILILAYVLGGFRLG